MMTSFNEMWDQFRREVVRTDDPEIVENYRRCFYSGAIALLSAIEAGGDSKDIFKELNAFYQELGNEKPARREF